MKMHKSLWLISGIVLFACQPKPRTITNGDLIYMIDDQMHTSVLSADADKPLTIAGTSEYLKLCDGKLESFSIATFEESSFNDQVGEGTFYEITGINKEFNIEKKLILKTYNEFPNLISTQVTYTNQSAKDLCFTAWVNNHYNIPSQQDEPPFWAFRGSSSGARADWIKPVEEGFYQKNFMGMNNSDYGGGIPVTDLWRPDAGIAIGHLSLTPELVSLPTELRKYDNTAQIAIQKDFDYPTYLAVGDSITTLETFVSVHDGDYYNGLQQFSQLMQARGIKMPKSEPEAYEPIWCAWGYERNFTLDEVIGTLPKVKELGIKWAVLDDGFQEAEGDWHTNKTKFPKGDDQMRDLVKTIHKNGLKAKLWWAPLAADPGSKLLAENPKMRLYLSDWAPQYITWWDAYYLSPTHPKTIAHTKEVVDLFLKEWDFDGLKMDGQHMNGVAPDHNPESGLENPEDAVRKLPEFYKKIYEEARSIKPHAVVENCPCGTCMSFYNMPYMNQAVSSDPTSSWQIRLKGKTYKALISSTAYYGDHVELSDGGADFASSFGVGAVLGTKFTWPADNPTASASYLLTPEKEKSWKHWFDLYNQKMLSKANYLGGLYDIGYDKPETHVIQKGDTLHYAFYAENWSGPVELRGLEPGNYTVRDYFNDRDLGEINGEDHSISIEFKDFMLLEVY